MTSHHLDTFGTHPQRIISNVALIGMDRHDEKEECTRTTGVSSGTSTTMVLLLHDIEYAFQKAITQLQANDFYTARKNLADCLDAVNFIQEQLNPNNNFNARGSDCSTTRITDDSSYSQKSNLVAATSNIASTATNSSSSVSSVPTTQANIATTIPAHPDQRTVEKGSPHQQEEVVLNVQRLKSSQLQYQYLTLSSIPLQMRTWSASSTDSIDGDTETTTAQNNNHTLHNNDGDGNDGRSNRTYIETETDVLLRHDFYFAAFNMHNIVDMFHSPKAIVVVTVAILFNIAITYHKEGAFDGSVVSYHKALHLYKTVLNMIKRSNEQYVVFPALLRVLLSTCHNIAHIYRDGFGNVQMCWKFIDAANRIEKNLIAKQNQQQRSGNNNNSTILLPQSDREFFAMNNYFSKISSGWCAQAA
jgi:hypothetical protein